MANPHYCSTGWNLYERLAGIVLCRNLETGEKYPEETFDRKKCEVAGQALDEHFRTCVQCSIEESRFAKKRATPAR